MFARCCLDVGWMLLVCYFDVLGGRIGQAVHGGSLLAFGPRVCDGLDDSLFGRNGVAPHGQHRLWCRPHGSTFVAAIALGVMAPRGVLTCVPE